MFVKFKIWCASCFSNILWNEVKIFHWFLNLNFTFEIKFCLPKIISWTSIWEMLHNGKSNLIGTQGDLGVHSCPPVTAIYCGAGSFTSPELSFLILNERAGLMSNGQTPVSWPQGPVVESTVTPGLELSMGCSCCQCLYHTHWDDFKL